MFCRIHKSVNSVEYVENCKHLLTSCLRLPRFSHVGKSSTTTYLTWADTLECLPPNVYIAPSGFEAELVTCRQHVKEINTSHELVCFNNDWPGNYCVCLLDFQSQHLTCCTGSIPAKEESHIIFLAFLSDHLTMMLSWFTLKSIDPILFFFKSLIHQVAFFQSVHSLCLCSGFIFLLGVGFPQFIFLCIIRHIEVILKVNRCQQFQKLIET